MTTKAPETIYAKVGYSDAADGVWSGVHNLRGDVCPPDEDEVVFVRADLHAAVVAERDALRGIMGELRQYITDSYQCGCMDAGCAGRHVERNAVLEGLSDILITFAASAAKLAKAEGRMCVNCGKVVPASHDRGQPGPDCLSPDACTFDLTMDEAWLYWRQKAHDAEARWVKDTGVLNARSEFLEDKLQAAEAALTKARAETAAVIEAVREEAETIIANPRGSLWNYGTTPTRVDEAEWRGATNAARDILSCLPASATATLDEIKRQAREEAIREALARATEWRKGYRGEDTIEDAILTLIERK